MSAGSTPVGTLLAEVKRHLQALYGDRLAGVYLYGSHARGEARADSDVDVLVVLRGHVQPGAEVSRAGPAVSAVSLEHDVLISLYPVSEQDFRERRSPFLESVRREAVRA